VYKIILNALDREYFDVEIFAADIKGLPVKGNDIIGYAYLKETDGDAHLTELYVLPEFQAKGVGKLLINYCTEYAKSKGCKKITTQMSGAGDKDRRLKFYLKEGFNTDSHIFEKDITENKLHTVKFCFVKPDRISQCALLDAKINIHNATVSQCAKYDLAQKTENGKS
jgi:GNAT superfamily N-acetyltransferase